jgi:hypothetical protein
VNIDQPRRRRKFIANDWEGRQYPASQEAALTLLQAQAQVLRAMPADEFPARFRHFAEWIMGIGEQILLPDSIREGLVFAARGREGSRDLLLEVGLKPQAPMMNGHHPEVEPPSAPTTTQGKAQVAQPSLERFRAFFAGEGSSEDPPMLIDGLLRENGVVIMGGQSQAGKSYVAVDLALSLSTGADFFGKEVKKPVGVIYAAPEGDDTIQPRILAAKKHRGMPDDEWPPILILPEFRLPMHTEKDDPFPAFVADLKKAREVFAERGMLQPGVLFIDTASAGIDMESEDANHSVAEVIERLKLLGRDLNMLVIVVHHFGKDAGRRLRGASAWFANSDQIFSVYSKVDANGIPTNPRSLWLDKLRGFPAGLVSAFNLSVLPGQDGPIGKWVYVSLAKIAGSEVPSVATTRPEVEIPGKTSRAGKLFLEAFAEALHSGERRQIERCLPHDVRCKCARVDDIRKHFEKGHAGTPEAIKRAFNREIKRIAELGLGFSAEGDKKGERWMWRPKDQSDAGEVIIDIKNSEEVPW